MIHHVGWDYLIDNQNILIEDKLSAGFSGNISLSKNPIQKDISYIVYNRVFMPNHLLQKRKEHY